MKQLPALVLVLAFHVLQAQTDTEVYLLDIYANAQGIELGSPKNISNNLGYDNQPSFYNDDVVLFPSTRNGQTDIAKYNIRDSVRTWLTETRGGSEYSPLKIPGKNEVSAIRLDGDGLQRLYRYDFETGRPSLLLEDLKVGYHLWFNKTILILAVLVEDRMDLVVSNLTDHTNYTFQKNVGRSLHKIPNSDLISFISKESGDWEIKSLNPVSGATHTICKTIPQSEDLCWLINGTILMGSGDTLWQFDTLNEGQWKSLKNFGVDNISNITRLQPNANSTKLLLVADEAARSQKNIKQKSP